MTDPTRLDLAQGDLQKPTGAGTFQIAITIAGEMDQLRKALEVAQTVVRLYGDQFYVKGDICVSVAPRQEVL